MNEETKMRELLESALRPGLERAAYAVVREALDDVDVHPCDEHNDAVRAAKLYGPFRELYDALRDQVLGGKK